MFPTLKGLPNWLDELITSVWREKLIMLAEFSFLRLCRSKEIIYHDDDVTYLNLILRLIHCFDFLNSGIELSIESHPVTLIVMGDHILYLSMTLRFYFSHCFQFRINLSIEKIINLFLYFFIMCYYVNSFSYNIFYLLSCLFQFMHLR